MIAGCDTVRAIFPRRVRPSGIAWARTRIAPAAEIYSAPLEHGTLGFTQRRGERAVPLRSDPQLATTRELLEADLWDMKEILAWNGSLSQSTTQPSGNECSRPYELRDWPNHTVPSGDGAERGPRPPLTFATTVSRYLLARNFPSIV